MEVGGEGKWLLPNTKFVVPPRTFKGPKSKVLAINCETEHLPLYLQKLPFGKSFFLKLSLKVIKPN